MTRLGTLVASAAVLALCAPTASAQQTTVRIPAPVAVLARSATHGAIQGVVLATDGRPLAGAMVSALGSTVAFALTDRDGRFTLGSLPVGAYTVRVHLDGFLPSRRQVIDVHGGRPAMLSVALQELSPPAAAKGTTVLVAGVAPFDPAPVTAGDSPRGVGKDGTDDHSETAWRLRHLKRSVLRTVDEQIALDPEPAEPSEGNLFGRAFESSMRLASALFTDTPLTGQVDFVTMGSFDAPAGLGDSATFNTANVAYVLVGAPAGSAGQWNVRGAMRQGELGSWFLAGTFSGRVPSAHRYTAGLSYGTQRVMPVNFMGRAALPGDSRSVGMVYGFDEWTLTRQLALEYGLAYAWQDYVASGGLLSPRVAVTVMPARQVRVRAAASRTAAAPGAEELIPAAAAGSDAWLPAQRSFSSWSGPDGFRVQRTDHFEVAVEGVSKDTVVGFRSFYQRVDDQMGVVFASPTAARPAASLGHYYAANFGDVDARGWGVSVSRPIIAGVRGSVDYSQTTARWIGPFDSIDQPLVRLARTGTERIYDLTTSVETDIPVTATRVFVFYRINSALASDEPIEATPGLDARFDVQVKQGLPFMGFTSADWEVLVAVRNLFRDPVADRSVFDELLVLRPPTRVVGGVSVRF